MCMQRGCTQIDLLGAKCRDCKKFFCSRHMLKVQHSCALDMKAAALVECPICKQIVYPESNEPIDTTVAKHIDGGCRQTAKPSPPPERLNFCSAPNCSRNEASLIVCPNCGNSYCVDHRHVHPCRVAPTPVTAAARVSRRQIPTSSKTKPLGLEFGKDVSHMVRDLEYACLQVVVPLSLQPLDASTTNFYFCVPKSTAAGRLLDSVCEHAGVSNANNRATTPGKSRLLFVESMSKTALPISPSSQVGSLPAIIFLTTGELLEAVDANTSSTREQTNTCRVV